MCDRLRRVDSWLERRLGWATMLQRHCTQQPQRGLPSQHKFTIATQVYHCNTSFYALTPRSLSAAITRALCSCGEKSHSVTGLEAGAHAEKKGCQMWVKMWCAWS